MKLKKCVGFWKLRERQLMIIGILLLAITLRIYKLGLVPISLHGDELGVGYNAYLLLTQGVDEYGKSWPMAFRADIPPLNFYATIPFIAILGKSELAIRLPNVIYGVLVVFITFLSTRKLFPKINAKFPVAELSALLIALSPWHIQASRIAYEPNLGLLLQLGGTYLFLQGNKKPQFWRLSAILLGLSLYAYHGPRLTTPLLVLFLVWWQRKNLKKNVTYAIQSLLIFILAGLPILGLILSRPLTENRLAGINIFIRSETLQANWQESNYDRSNLGRLLFHHPLLIYGLTFLRQYFNYVNFDNLFFDSVQLRYFYVRNSGLLYLWELPFLLTGLYQLLIDKKIFSRLVLFWLVIAPLPGALTLGPPNVGRSFMLLPMLQVTTAIGVGKIIISLKEKSDSYFNLIKILIFGALLFNVCFFLHQYFVHSTQLFARQWGYGLKEAVETVLPYEKTVNQIVFSQSDQTLKSAYIYVLFYGNKDYGWLNSVSKQRHSFIGYQSFGPYQFRVIDWELDKALPNSIFVGTSDDIPDSGQVIKDIKDLNGNVILRVAKT